MKKDLNLTIAVLSVLLSLVAAQPTPADIANGDFSFDISVPGNGWDPPAGPVDWVDWSEDAPAAYFHPDGTAGQSTLSQTITVASGFSVLSFDVVMETEFLGGGETDVFTASLGSTELYSLSSSDLTASRFEETITRDVSSFIGQGQVALVFKLAHDNSVGDPVTTVLLDNVELVPVPGAFVLGGLGLSLAGWGLRKRRSLCAGNSM